MNKPTKLQIAAEAAQRRWYKMSRELEDMQDERIRVATEKIKADIEANFSAELASLAAAKYAAEQAELEERERLAAAPYPVGTRLCGWKDVNPCRYGNCKANWKLIAHGIVEICTRETVHPASNKYDRASVGDTIVRLLKKDGTPGAKYERLKSYRGHTWLPEGEEPK